MVVVEWAGWDWADILGVEFDWQRRLVVISAWNNNPSHRWSQKGANKPARMDMKCCFTVLMVIFAMLWQLQGRGTNSYLHVVLMRYFIATHTSLSHKYFLILTHWHLSSLNLIICFAFHWPN